MLNFFVNLLNAAFCLVYACCVNYVMIIRAMINCEK